MPDAKAILLEDEEKERLEDRIAYLKNNSDEYIDKRKSRLNRTLKTIEDRDAINEENITMKEHLTDKINRLENEPDEVLDEKIQKLEDRLEDLEGE